MKHGAVEQPDHVLENKKARQRAALAGIRHMGTIAEGCRRATVSRTTIADWRKDDPEFDNGVVMALEDYRDSLSEEITRRGRDGYEEPVIHQGQLCYRIDAEGNLLLDDNFEPIILTVKKHSDKLLELNAKAYDDRYRDKSSLEVTGAGGGAVEQAITVQYVLPNGKTVDDYDKPDTDPALAKDITPSEPTDPLE